VPPGDVLRKYRLVLRFRAENRRLVSVVRRRATARGAACGGPGLTGSPARGRPSPCGDVMIIRMCAMTDLVW